MLLGYGVVLWLSVPWLSGGTRGAGQGAGEPKTKPAALRGTKAALVDLPPPPRRIRNNTNPNIVSAACSFMNLNANYPSHLKMVVN